MEIVILLLLVVVLSAFLGFELISKVPSTLHTPLMSGSNAISGITIISAIITITGAIYTDNAKLQTILGMCALIAATINVVGGYLVTDRMLLLFKKKKK